MRGARLGYHRRSSSEKGALDMTAAEKETSVREVIARIGNVPAEFPANADLYTEVGLDSFRMVEIFLEIERRFGVAISEDDYLRLRSVAQFMALLEQRP